MTMIDVLMYSLMMVELLNKIKISKQANMIIFNLLIIQSLHQMDMDLD